MRLAATLMLAVALAIFAAGRVGSFIGQTTAADFISATSDHEHEKVSGHSTHTHLAADHKIAEHSHTDEAGSAGDANCSSHCCSFACHFVTIDLRSAFVGPDYSYARFVPTETTYLAGRQPLGLDRPPRAA